MKLSKPEAGESDFEIQSLKKLKPWMWLDSTSFEGDTSEQGAIVESKDVVCICPTTVINFFLHFMFCLKYKCCAVTSEEILLLCSEGWAI